MPHIQNRFFCRFHSWLEVAALATLLKTQSHTGFQTELLRIRESAAIGSQSSVRPKRQVREPG